MFGKKRKTTNQVLKDEIELMFYENYKKSLQDTRCLAQLIIDSKNNKLSIGSREFLCRLNIQPKVFDRPTKKKK